MSNKKENGVDDEGSTKWRWRPPPRGVGTDAYTICDAWISSGGTTCRYGVQCVEAHGQEELDEWRNRFEERKARLSTASYTETLLEKWSSADIQSAIISEKLPAGVSSLTCEDLSNVVAASKHSKTNWTISAQSTGKTRLKVVALLQDSCREHFRLAEIQIRSGNGTAHTWRPNTNQDWKVPDSAYKGLKAEAKIHYKIKVTFSTDIYGTFRQSIVFDFGTFPVSVKHISVEVIPSPSKTEDGDAVEGDPEEEEERMREVRSLVVSSAGRWVDGVNADVVPFMSDAYLCLPLIHQPRHAPSESDKQLVAKYPVPQPNEFVFTASVTDRLVTINNYVERMHQLLYIEELARYDLISHFNVQVDLRLASSYLLACTSAPGSGGGGGGTAKYAPPGELYAHLALSKDVSEDTCSGRLILNNCTSIFISPNIERENEKDKKRRVYEAVIEDKGKNVVYLRLSNELVKLYNLKADTDFPAEIQFQLNRLPFCEWHFSVDQMKSNVSLMFPETALQPSIPWNPQRQWNDSLDSRLNPKQKEAVVAITTPCESKLPPILLIGPFGTGKTYTLAQAIKQILLQPNTRVLVCTHSNSAADLYIKDYLHPHVTDGHEEARPLRIYYKRRWVTTVNQIVQKYCLIDVTETERTFRDPTVEDIENHRVVVVTLSISMYLSGIGLKKGHFTHILLDEAAQAMECEAIMPLAIADERTRIVLAGDHMQLSPEVHSPFAREKSLHFSLLERLYDHYPSNYPCKILLCENYRAHEAIIQFTSELFYDQKLISSGNQPRHEKLYPLTFYTTRGEDVQETNSTAFYNISEVYELVERVADLRRKWPKEWGRVDEHSIGVMTPYADQVFRIRAELRKRRMGGISVERVLNVQGKQFRAIFLSTVRTRSTCKSGAKEASAEDMDYGFLSNSKLLNTAITRAQSLVAVVGDPVALCSIGRCRKVWERFINICHQNRSLYGITWAQLRAQLDGVELRSTYTLNPLAPEFVPRQMQAEMLVPRGPTPTNSVTGANISYRMPMPVTVPYQPMVPMFVPAMMQTHPIVYPPPPQHNNWKMKTVPSPPQKLPPVPRHFHQQPPQAQPQPPYWPYPFHQPQNRMNMAPPTRPALHTTVPPTHPPPPPPTGPRMPPERQVTPVQESEAPKQFQFLQNVHFPERHSSPSLSTNSWDTNQNNRDVQDGCDVQRNWDLTEPMRQAYADLCRENPNHTQQCADFAQALGALTNTFWKSLQEKVVPPSIPSIESMEPRRVFPVQQTVIRPQPPPGMMQAAATPPAAPSRISPYQHLLPPNITLEMMLLNNTMQYDWHKFLVDTAGPDIGAKFVEMIVAANNYKKKINASQTDPGPSNAAYGQQNMNMQQQMQQKMSQQQQQQLQHGLLPPMQSNVHQHQRSQMQQQQNLTSPQQLSPMSLQFQNDVVNDVVRSLDELLASSSISEKNKYLASIPDRIPLPPQYESSLVTHQMPMASKFHSEYTNGHSSNQHDRRMYMEEPIPLPSDFRVHEVDRMPAMPPNMMTQSRLFALQQSQDNMMRNNNWPSPSASMNSRLPHLENYSPVPENFAERLFRAQSPPHPDHEPPMHLDMPLQLDQPSSSLTYASVLRAKPQPSPSHETNKMLLENPFAVLRELGTRSSSQLQSNSNLPYNFFSQN